jgi:hypothetical protein
MGITPEFVDGSVEPPVPHDHYRLRPTYFGVGFRVAPPLMFEAFFDETDLRGRSFTFELFLAAMVSLLWW